MNKKVLTAIEAEGIEQLNLKLLAFAVKLLKPKFWQNGTKNATKGRVASDFVQNALKLALDSESKRNWNTKKYLTVYDYLVSIIKSEVSNSVRSYENNSSTNSELFFSNENASVSTLKADDKLIVSEKLERLKLAVKNDVRSNDDWIEYVLELMLNGKNKPREIEKELELPINKVYEIVRRIKDIAKPILNN